MKEKKITTMSELRFNIQAEARKKIYDYLMSGDYKGKKVEIEINNWYEPFGSFVCEIKEWRSRQDDMKLKSIYERKENNTNRSYQ